MSSKTTPQPTEFCSVCRRPTFLGRCINNKCVMFAMGTPYMKTQAVKQGLGITGKSFDPIMLANRERINRWMEEWKKRKDNKNKKK